MIPRRIDELFSVPVSQVFPCGARPEAIGSIVIVVFSCPRSELVAHWCHESNTPLRRDFDRQQLRNRMPLLPLPAIPNLQGDLYEGTPSIYCIVLSMFLLMVVLLD